jgi:hypothetical protein
MLSAAERINMKAAYPAAVVKACKRWRKVIETAGGT